jgi:hypothetical protein
MARCLAVKQRGGVSVNILLGSQLQESKSKPGNLNEKGKPDDFSFYFENLLHLAPPFSWINKLVFSEPAYHTFSQSPPQCR